MKIALTISEKNENSKVDSRFGRCPYFLIINDQTGERKIIDNTQNLNAMQGAGIQAAQNLLKENPDVLITGNIGPKAFMLLSEKVKIYTGAGDLSVNEAIEKFKKGELKQTTVATKPGHW